ncbi:MAG: hypothetical protein ACLS48_12235 [[Eubacterium] siraeum]
MNKEYTIRDLYEIYCEAMPRYPLAYERSGIFCTKITHRYSLRKAAKRLSVLS